MPDSNNNQEPVVNEAFALKVDVKVLVAVVALVFLAVYFVMTFSQRIGDEGMSLSPVEMVPEDVPSEEVPLDSARTDFGTDVPPGIPETIPVAKGESVTQSYTLQYETGQQSTSVFNSPLTVKENYAKYTEILEKEGWVITNKSESEMVSSLYGLKLYSLEKNSEINVTINASSTKAASSSSQVSVSIFNN